MGSLVEPGGNKVGSFARESLTDIMGSQVRALGPSTSVREYHTSSVELILDLILREEMYTLQPVNAYLIHRFLLDIIQKVLPPERPDSNNDGPFYLKHADDKGDHILVDDDFNITGIIDWEWAHTAPFAIDFNSPIGFIPVGQFYEGNNTLGEDEVTLAQLLEEKGRRDLAKAVWDGRLQHRFAFCCGYDLAADWTGFLGLFRGLRDAVGVDNGMEWDEWRGKALERYKPDAGLNKLLEQMDVKGMRSSLLINPALAEPGQCSVFNQ